jgi:hypothetical protein
MLVQGSIAAWLVVLGSLCAIAQDAPLPTTATAVDLRCQFPAGKAIEIRLQSTTKGTLELRLPREQRTVPCASARDERLLDEMLSLDSTTHAFEQRRTWLDARETVNGATSDPPLTGVCVTYTSDGTKLSATLGDRLLPPGRLDGLLRQSGFVGMWLGLPEAAVAGRRYRFDAAGLIQTLFATESEPKVTESWLTLDRVDLETSVAHVTMHLEFTDTLADDDGMTADLAYVVESTGELQLGERRLARITSSGTVTLAGTNRFEGMVSGSIQLTSTVTSKVIGDVKAALATTSAPRDNAYVFDEAGFRCALPSYWARFPRKDAKTLAQFLDSRDDVQTLIQIHELDDDGDPHEDAYIKAFTKGVVQSGFIEPVIRKTKSALGNALEYSAALEGERRVVGMLAVCGKTRKLSVQLIGSADATKRAETDFAAFLKSLKPAK